MGFVMPFGLRWSSVVLELADVWPAYRKRWWCLLTRVQKRPVALTAWQPRGPWKKVGDVLHFPEQDGPAVRQIVEVEECQSRKPLDSFVLRSSAAMPTALHSGGAQITACPCGCRLHPFRASRLDAKLCAVLLRVGGGPMRQYRHLTPKEAALLNGLDPLLVVGDDARLAPTLVGQLASPLQSAWVFSQLRQQHGLVDSHFTPDSVLRDQCWNLIQSAVKCGLRTDAGLMVRSAEHGMTPGLMNPRTVADADSMPPVPRHCIEPSLAATHVGLSSAVGGARPCDCLT